MKRPWAFICAAEGTSSAHLRRYCRTVFECGYVPVCPRLQDGQFVALDDPDERHIYNDIVRDKLLRCPEANRLSAELSTSSQPVNGFASIAFGYPNAQFGAMPQTPLRADGGEQR